MTKLFDVIDTEDAEKMLEQHDRYQFGRMAVVRDGGEWMCYWGVVEAHWYGSGYTADTVRYPTLAAALEFALSPRTIERLGDRDRVERDISPHGV